MRNLGTLGGKNSDAIDLNDATQVVGWSETADGNAHAFLWTPGRGMEDLGTLGGASSLAWGISRDRGRRRPERDRRRQVGRVPVDPGARHAESGHPARSARDPLRLASTPTCGSLATASATTDRSAVPVDAGRGHAAPAHARRRRWGGRGPERVRPDRGREHQRRTATIRATLWTPGAGPLAVTSGNPAVTRFTLERYTVAFARLAPARTPPHIARSSSRPKGHMAEPTPQQIPEAFQNGDRACGPRPRSVAASPHPPLAAQGVTGAAIEGRVLDATARRWSRRSST